MTIEVTQEITSSPDKINHNTFNQIFNYPPSKEEAYENDKINRQYKLFNDGRMIHNGWKCSKCTCGNLYEDIILESNNTLYIMENEPLIQGMVLQHVIT